MVLTRWQRRLRVATKRFVYSQLYLRESLFILIGKSKPIVRFTVEASPPSLYFNFAILPGRLDELARQLDLPHPLAPIRCLEREEPFYCLTLNIYRVSGLANGIRAEWSLYVRGPDGVPRYLVVEAVADAGSMDPVAIISRAGQISHEQTADGERVVAHELGVESEARLTAEARVVGVQGERAGIDRRGLRVGGRAHDHAQHVPDVPAALDELDREPIE